jgi:hypothetical protein
MQQVLSFIDEDNFQPIMFPTAHNWVDNGCMHELHLDFGPANLA